jgi:hypothetical protein
MSYRLIRLLAAETPSQHGQLGGLRMKQSAGNTDIMPVGVEFLAMRLVG